MTFDPKKFMADVFTSTRKGAGDARQQAKAALGSLPIVANALVADNKKRVSVVYSSQISTGCTDGKRITLLTLPVPSNHEDMEKLHLQLSLGYGLIHHEIGHVNDSDFTVVGEAVKEGPLVHNLLGIIEDVRQENRHIAKYPNSRKYLDALCAALQVTGGYTSVTTQDPPMHALTGYLLYRLYADYRKDPTVRELADEAEKVVAESFPRGLLVRLETILPDMHSLTCSRDALNLSMKIRDVLKEEKEKEEQEQKAQQGQQGKQGDSGDQNQQQGSGGKGDSDGDKDGDQDKDGKGSGKSGDKGDQDQKDGSGGQSQTPAGDDSAGGSGASPHDRVANAQSVLDGEGDGYGDRDDKAREAVSELNDSIDAVGSLPMTDGGQEDVTTATTDTSQVNLRGYNLNQALASTGRLRVKLIRELQANTEQQRIVGKRGRRISGRHLYRVALDDPRILLQRHVEEEIDTGVVILQDVSGSMRGPRIELVCQAGYATAVALDAIDNVECAVATFPSGIITKPFGGKARRLEAGMSINAYGRTPMTEGIMLGIRMLKAAAKRRSIMLIATDGSPNDPASAAVMIAAAEAWGYEVYGLGIQSNAGTNLFRHGHWQSINDINALPDTVLGLIRARLIRRAA